MTIMKIFAFLLVSILLFNRLHASPQARGKGRAFLGSKAKDLPTMPNIDYAYRGYHLLIGNPLATGHQADPGFHHAIFQPTYSGYVTGDLRYQVPDGFQVYQKPICNVDFSSKSYANEKKYQDEIKVSVDVDFGGWGAAFSANSEYQRNTQSMSKSQQQFVKTEALCGVYEVEMDIFNPPNITIGFGNAIRLLENGDDLTYLKFVETYGTHLITNTHMGAKYTEQMEMSKESKETLERQGISLEVAASYSSMYHINVEASGSYDKENVEKFDNEVMSRSIISYGSRPPTDSNALSWTNSVFHDPLPISYGLLHIQDLFTERVMGNLGVDYEKIGDKLIRFLEVYCENYKGGLGIKDCTGPKGGCAGGQMCHTNAICKDVEYMEDDELKTSYECKCKEHYEGNGYQCSGWGIQKDLTHDLYSLDAGPGTWHPVEMCPHKTYAHAIALKIEPDIGNGDDTGLNGIKLYCESYDGKTTGEVTSGVGPFGEWRQMKTCKSKQTFFNGFRFKSEGPVAGDDTWGDDVDVMCGDGQILEGNGPAFGHWSSWTFCPKNSWICGLQTMIERRQGGGDDTALDNMKFICCQI